MDNCFLSVSDKPAFLATSFLRKVVFGMECFLHLNLVELKEGGNNMLLTKGLLASVKHYPDKYAVLDEEVRLTYKELYDRIKLLAKSLQLQGVKKGDRVGILMNNNYRFIEIKYASLLIGAIFSPISTKLSLSEMEYILNDCEPSHLFIGQDFIHLLPHIKQTTSIKHFVYVSKEKGSSVVGAVPYDDLLEEAGEFQEVEIFEDDIAGIYYTGGTTGKAKGVMLSHKNLVANIYHTLSINDYSSDDIYFHVNPMFHLAGSVPVFIFTTIGAAHCMNATFDPEQIFEKIDQYQVTRMTLVPSMINMLIHHPKVGAYQFTSLKTIRYGASPMPFEILKKARQVFDCHFSANYGMTEASPVLSSLTEEDHEKGFGTEDEEVKKRLLSVGRQVIGVELRIVDQEGDDVAEGEVGEIVAKGPNIMKGYWRKPEETAEVLKDGWYYTGDMGYYGEDEYIYLADRKKDMIISGGLNIYSVEVENAIYQSPEVLEVAVIGVPDAKWIEAVKAFVVLKPEKGLSEEELLRRCRELLSRYKVPKSVEFVAALPKSAAGKILKTALREQDAKVPSR